jgi:hypothetical protein
MKSSVMRAGRNRAIKGGLKGLLLATVWNCGPGARAAGAPDPGDYAAAPPGVTVGILYGQSLRADKVYVDANKVVGDLGLRLDVGVARVVHYLEVAGLPADIQLIQPFGRQRVDLSGYSESGYGNLTFGGTVWTLSDKATGEQLGWTAFLTVPTGQHRDRAFFASEDRYALTLEAGYIRKLSDAFTLDLIGQTEFYTRDKTTDIHRAALARGFAHLRYHLSPASHVALSYRLALGARETLGGTTVAGAKRDSNVMLTWASWVTPKVNLQLQYAKDVAVRNGPAVKGLQARLAHVF